MSGSRSVVDEVFGSHGGHYDPVLWYVLMESDAGFV